MTDAAGKRGMRIGLMGGTFDPIHLGHLIVAEHVRVALDFAQIWLLPAASPPHKRESAVAPAKHRLKMAELAVEDNPHILASDAEFSRPGRSYTVETVEMLQHRYPQHAFYFIIGVDMVIDLPNWHRIEDLLDRIPFIGVMRPGYDWPSSRHPFAERVRYVNVPLIDISATEVRKRLSRGESCRYLIPDRVYSYIREHRLYGS